MIKIKVLNASIKNTRFSKHDVLPNQVHYNIAVNKRIKLLEEIYKWHYRQINHIWTTNIWVQTSTKCTAQVDPVCQKIWRQTLPFKNRHFIKSKELVTLKTGQLKKAGSHKLTVHELVRFIKVTHAAQPQQLYSSVSVCFSSFLVTNRQKEKRYDMGYKTVLQKPIPSLKMRGKTYPAITGS